MLRTLSQFLFYNETRPFIQKNVLILTHLSLLQLLVMVYDATQQRWHTVLSDLPLLIIVALIWWCIKKHGIYYANIIFLVLVPLFSWLLFESIKTYGVMGVIWSFPVIAVLFFCFYKHMAWLATSLILVVTFNTCLSYVSHDKIFTIMVALFMVTYCFTKVFLNIYDQYSALSEKINRDPMTGLLNRTSLEQTMISSINNTEAGANTIVIALDLDSFKYINDTFGHLEGDRVLIHISQLLVKNTRKTDFVFRMGGEEFLIVLNNIGLNNARKVSENIRHKIESSTLIDNHIITGSLGIAVHKEDAEWGQVLKRADDAMYRAKNTGKNKVVVIE